jgi:hypothetical protein
MDRYVNQTEYHQWFINAADKFPDELKRTPENQVLVWANGLRVFDAGRNGGDGGVDLLTIDEEGMVWVLEAKLWNNTELNRGIWNQLGRYRQGLMSTDWNTIHRYSRSFIRGKRPNKPRFPQFQGCEDLIQVLRVWQQIINRTKMPAENLKNYLAQSLQQGTFGLAVLAERYSEDVIKGAENFVHDGPLAYILAVPEKGNLEIAVKWLKKSKKFQSQIIELNSFKQSAFDKYEKEMFFQKCVPGNFWDGLCLGARSLWDRILEPWLIEHGWDERSTENNKKSLQINLPVGSDQIYLFRSGWASTDSKYVIRENKTFGNFALRLHWWLWLNKGKPFMEKDFIESWAKKLYEQGWRGSGDGKNLGVSPLSQEEFKRCTLVMKYKPEKGVQEFTGRPGDENALTSFLNLMDLFLKDIEKNYYHPISTKWKN